MYCAKEAGRNRFQFFDDMNPQVVERLTLEHRAITAANPSRSTRSSPSFAQLPPTACRPG
jgi:hypothetical protein